MRESADVREGMIEPRIERDSTLTSISGLRLGRDDEFQPCVSFPQSFFDSLGRISAAEDEPEVPGSLGKRRQLHAYVNGDGNLFDVGNGSGLRLSANLAQNSGPRDWDHHHPCGPTLSLEGIDFQTERVSKDQFL